MFRSNKAFERGLPLLQGLKQGFYNFYEGLQNISKENCMHLISPNALWILNNCYTFITSNPNLTLKLFSKQDTTRQIGAYFEVTYLSWITLWLAWCIKYLLKNLLSNKFTKIIWNIKLKNYQIFLGHASQCKLLLWLRWILWFMQLNIWSIKASKGHNYGRLFVFVLLATLTINIRIWLK